MGGQARRPHQARHPIDFGIHHRPAKCRRLVVAPPFIGRFGVRRPIAFLDRQSPVLAPETYAALLHRLGYRRQVVRLQVYGHELESREAVIEWVGGSVLTDYERRMPAEIWPRFLERYRERLLPQLADTRPYFYPFRRILFWAER